MTGRVSWFIVALVVLMAASVPLFALAALIVGPLIVVANLVLYFRLFGRQRRMGGWSVRNQ